jgi:hypothetical protein
MSLEDDFDIRTKLGVDPCIWIKASFPLAPSLQAGVEGKDARGMVMGRV